MLIGSTGDQAHSRVLEDIWRKTIAAIPSDFGKLAYLSSLRDPNSGRYNHYGLEALYSSEQSDRALHQTHINVFCSWLGKTLAEQKDDLEHYFRTAEGELPAVLENWKEMEPYRAYIPADADRAGRKLFLDDLALIVDLMLRQLVPPARPTTA